MVDSEQAFSIAIGQRLEKHAVKDGKNRGVGADGDCEGDDCDQREIRRFHQSTKDRLQAQASPHLSAQHLRNGSSNAVKGLLLHLGADNVCPLDYRKFCEKCCSLCHKRLCYRPVQVVLPSGFVTEGVKDSESGRPEPQRNHNGVVVSLFASSSPCFRKAATSSSFPGFASSRANKLSLSMPSSPEPLAKAPRDISRSAVPLPRGKNANFSSIRAIAT